MSIYSYGIAGSTWHVPAFADKRFRLRSNLHGWAHIMSIYDYGIVDSIRHVPASGKIYVKKRSKGALRLLRLLRLHLHRGPSKTSTP